MYKFPKFVYVGELSERRPNLLAVIAAGGTGSRMGGTVPKPLTLLPNGETFLDFMVAKLSGVAHEIVVVVSPAVLLHESFTRNPDVDYRLQLTPTGMGDAVFCAADRIVLHDSIIVVWCDQVGLTSETIRASTKIHLENSQTDSITLPVFWKESPYIHIEHTGESITRILQAREGDLVPSPSLSDVGLFILKGSQTLLQAWFNGGRESSIGPATNEANFLPFLVHLSNIGWEVTFTQATKDDAIGVNNARELKDAIDGGLV